MREILDHLRRFGHARNRETDRVIRLVTITDDDAALLVWYIEELTAAS